MPYTKSEKSGVLETLIEKQVSKAVKRALKKEDVATSKEQKIMLREIRSLKKEIRRLSTSKLIQSAGKNRAGRKPIHLVCTRRGCDKAHYAKGLCASHYQKQRREETLGIISKPKSKKARSSKKKSRK